jgi:acyl carrier protein
MTIVTSQDDVRRDVIDYLSPYVEAEAELLKAHLITDGLLDSLAMVRMIAYLENTFGFTVEDDDLDIENFDTVDSVVGFVCRKMA